MNIAIEVDCTDERATIVVRRKGTQMLSFLASDYPAHLEPWDRMHWIGDQLPASKSILFAVTVAVDVSLGFDLGDDAFDEMRALTQKSTTSH